MDDTLRSIYVNNILTQDDENALETARRAWLGMTRHIPDDYTLVEIWSNTDPDHYSEFLQRQSDRYQREASIAFMTRDVAREKAIREKLFVIARDKKDLFKKVIDDMYKGIEYVFEVEEKLTL